MAEPTKEYQIEFHPDTAKLDEVDWKWRKFNCYVRPFTGPVLPLKIEEIIRVKDDSNSVLVRKPEIISDLYFVQGDVNVNRNHIDKLQENNSYEVTAKVRIDPENSLVLLGPAMMPVPGMARAAASALKPPKEVEGKVKIKVEYPHPYIEIPFLKSNPNAEFLVDSTKPGGSDCEVHLRKFIPKPNTPEKYSYENRDEKLEVAIDKDEIKKNLQVGDIHDSKFFIKTKRIIIGREEKPAGRVRIARPEKNGPKPKNQDIKVPVKYKPYPTAKLAITVKIKGLPDWQYERLVNGEKVTLAWRELPLAIADKDKGEIKWKILPGTPRIPLPGTPEANVTSFKLEGSTRFKRVTLPDQTICTGAYFEIANDPLTEAESVELEVDVANSKPELELEVAIDPPAATDAQGNPLDRTADANGDMNVIITPKFSLFGEPFEGGLKITEFPSDKAYFDKYFQQLPPSFIVLSNGEKQEQARLRCRFHLNDQQILALQDEKAKVKLKILLDGSLATGKYKRFTGPLPSTAAEAEITLRPSKIDWKVNPKELPGSILIDKPQLFQALLTGTVNSASGRPVKSPQIADDISRTANDISIKRTAGIIQNPLGWRFEGDLWKFDFSFQGVTAAECKPFEYAAHSINDQGQVMFVNKPVTPPDSSSSAPVAPDSSPSVPDLWGNSGSSSATTSPALQFSSAAPDPFFLYDHVDRNWDNQTYHLQGQDSRMTAVFSADGVLCEPVFIDIKKQVKSVHISWDYAPYYLNHGRLTHPYYFGLADPGENAGQDGGFHRERILKYLTTEKRYKAIFKDARGIYCAYDRYRLQGGMLCPNCGAKYAARTQSCGVCRVQLGKYVKMKYEKNVWVEETSQELPVDFVLGTVLIGDANRDGYGSHHGIVEGSKTVVHFLMASGKPQFKWFNRDQIEKKKKDQGNRPKRAFYNDFPDAYVYVDSLEEWLKSKGSRGPYSLVEVLYPP